LDGELREKRNDIVLALSADKVGCSIYYPQPVPRMKYYAQKYDVDAATYENAAVISDTSIALPVGPHLEPSDMDLIAQALERKIADI
jgi:dTDP-4-amino-4,6-dideoxygalactose transaminase